jgi:NodT family efflux transporter outer membrane factor (OMF) lipoprotein
MKKQLITLTLAALTLSSCGVYTKYKPVKEAPENLYGEEVTTTDDANFGTMPWRQVFTDPQLQALIEKALANNTDLQTAQLRVKEAEATMLSAKLAYLPALYLSPTGTVSSFDKQKATQTYSLPVTASWELDIFGRIRNAKRQSKALLEQSRDYRQAVQSGVVAGVANIYYTLLMLDAQLDIAEQTEQSWKESVESTRALMDAGLTNETAVSQMEAAYYAVGASVISLREQINTVENSLSLLLAETPQAQSRGTLEGQTFPEQLSAGVPVEMLKNRPDVRSAQRAVEAAFYGVNGARSSFYPNITLSGSAGWTNSAGTMIINPAKFVASAVASLTQPIFNRGQNIAALKIAKAQREEAQLAFTQTLLNAGAEVNEAIVAYQGAREKSVLYAQQVEALKRALEKTQLLMDYDHTTYLDVLTAKQSLLSAQLDEVANRVTEIQSVISLYQALGGGAE